jgi:hypothetical protein
VSTATTVTQRAIWTTGELSLKRDNSTGGVIKGLAENSGSGWTSLPTATISAMVPGTQKRDRRQMCLKAGGNEHG